MFIGTSILSISMWRTTCHCTIWRSFPRGNFRTHSICRTNHTTACILVSICSRSTGAQISVIWSLSVIRFSYSLGLVFRLTIQLISVLRLTSRLTNRLTIRLTVPISISSSNIPTLALGSIIVVPLVLTSIIVLPLVSISRISSSIIPFRILPLVSISFRIVSIIPFRIVPSWTRFRFTPLALHILTPLLISPSF